MPPFFPTLPQVLRRVLARVRRSLGPGADLERYVGQVTVISDGLDIPVVGDSVALSTDFALHSALRRLHVVLQSKRHLRLDGSFKVHVLVHDTSPPGAAQSPVRRVGHTETASRLARLGVWDPRAGKRPALVPADADLAGPEFADCCLLLAIVLGLARLEDLAAGDEPLPNSDYRILRRALLRRDALAHSDVVAAGDVLRHRADRLLRRAGLSAADFSDVAVDHTLRLKVDRLRINLNLYEAVGGYNRLFSHPLVYDAARPNIDLLLVSVPNSSLSAHCALIESRRSLFRFQSKMLCYFCDRHYGIRNFDVHKCSRYPRCARCRRRTLRPGDYRDAEVSARCCVEDPEGRAVACPRCSMTTLGGECLRVHLRNCRRYQLRRCDRCGKFRQGGAGRAVHDCSRPLYCTVCHTHYGDDVGRHVCQMARPSPPKTMPRLVVWDTETTVCPRTKRHRINAVGASFEHGERGVFSYVAFYDDEMGYGPDRDGKVEEGDFEFVYWREGCPLDFPKHNVSRRRRRPRRRGGRRTLSPGVVPPSDSSSSASPARRSPLEELPPSRSASPSSPGSTDSSPSPGVGRRRRRRPRPLSSSSSGSEAAEERERASLDADGEEEKEEEEEEEEDEAAEVEEVNS